MKIVTDTIHCLTFIESGNIKRHFIYASMLMIILLQILRIWSADMFRIGIYHRH
jgi:hypothetical protein